MIGKKNGRTSFSFNDNGRNSLVPEVSFLPWSSFVLLLKETELKDLQNE